MPFAVAAFVVLGFVFLAREAEATEWLRKAIKRRAEVGRSPSSTSYNFVSRFLDALLSCASCCAAWAAPPAIGLLYLVNALDTVQAALCIVFVVGPLAAIGLLYCLTLLSPAQMIGILTAAAARSKKRTEETKDATQR